MSPTKSAECPNCPECQTDVEPVDTNNPDVWGRIIADGFEVSFAFMFPDCCPKGCESNLAGRIHRGMFFPENGVASVCFDEQRSINESRHKPRDPNSHVYFIQAEHGGPVKIGTAKCAHDRLCGLQTGYPYRLVIRGILRNAGRPTERQLHSQFAECRLQGEWFDPTPELEALMNSRTSTPSTTAGDKA